MSYCNFSNKTPRQALAIIGELERAERRAEAKRMMALAAFGHALVKADCERSQASFSSAHIAWRNLQRLKRRHNDIRVSALLAKARWDFEVLQREMRQRPAWPSDEALATFERPLIAVNCFCRIANGTYEMPGV